MNDEMKARFAEMWVKISLNFFLKSNPYRSIYFTYLFDTLHKTELD